MLNVKRKCESFVGDLAEVACSIIQFSQDIPIVRTSNQLCEPAYQTYLIFKPTTITLAS